MIDDKNKRNEETETSRHIKRQQKGKVGREIQT